jgi:hypothetical protein
MKPLKFAFSLAILLMLLFLDYSSFAAEKQKLCEERFQLVAAQYEDSNGKVHPIVYRIDTMTGDTSFIYYSVKPMNKTEVRGFVYENVFKDDPSFFFEIQRLEKIIKEK